MRADKKNPLFRIAWRQSEKRVSAKADQGASEAEHSASPGLASPGPPGRMKPTPAQHAATQAHICECLALLNRTTAPTGEQRDAARSLGLEHMLPGVQPEQLDEVA